jgi:hypothetical protein
MKYTIKLLNRNLINEIRLFWANKRKIFKAFKI